MWHTDDKSLCCLTRQRSPTFVYDSSRYLKNYSCILQPFWFIHDFICKSHTQYIVISNRIWEQGIEALFRVQPNKQTNIAKLLTLSTVTDPDGMQISLFLTGRLEKDSWMMDFFFKMVNSNPTHCLKILIPKLKVLDPHMQAAELSKLKYNPKQEIKMSQVTRKPVFGCLRSGKTQPGLLSYWD